MRLMGTSFFFLLTGANPYSSKIALRVAIQTDMAEQFCMFSQHKKNILLLLVVKQLHKIIIMN